MEKCKSCSKYYGSPRISSEFKDCALPLTFDQYNHCSFGCKYCFGVQFKECNPAYKGGIVIKPVNHIRLSKIILGKEPNNPYYQNFFKNRFIFHWGGLNEPFCHIEKKYKVGLEIMKTLSSVKYPTLFSTKGLSMFLDNNEYMDIFQKGSESNHFAFQFSIITNSDETSKKIEPNTPVTSERLKAMKAMSDLGYWTILRLRPFIIGITDINLEDLLQHAKDNGAKAVSTEFFAIDKRVAPMLSKQFNAISDIIGFNILDYYTSLSPHERGGYGRLNRDVKEPFMKRLYKKCKEIDLEVNISDPDFKELNDSGCCCGLPEEYELNTELASWSKGQLTYQLKELRKKYWLTGNAELKFEDIDKLVINKWYEEPKYLKDSIKYWNTDFAKVGVGHKSEFIHSWNNLRSPDNPYNYFMGVLKPSSVDKNGMLIYKYNPQSYEKRWKLEGLL